MAKYNRYSLPNQQSIFAFFCLFFLWHPANLLGPFSLIELDSFPKSETHA